MPYVRQRTWTQRAHRGLGQTVYGPDLSLADPAQLVAANANLSQQVSDLTAGIQYRDSLLSGQASTFQSFLSQHQSALLLAAAAVFGLVILKGRL